MVFRTQYILQYLAKTNDDVIKINYKTGLIHSLYRENEFDKGVLLGVKYYNVERGEDGEIIRKQLVLRVKYYYTRDSKGNVISRESIRQYIQSKMKYEDKDIYGEHYKHNVKYYDNFESILEGKRRRRNVIDKIFYSIEALSDQIDGDVVTLYEECVLLVGRYIDINSNDLKDYFLNSNIDMLELPSPLTPDITIREALLNILDIPISNPINYNDIISPNIIEE